MEVSKHTTATIRCGNPGRPLHRAPRGQVLVHQMTSVKEKHAQEGREFSSWLEKGSGTVVRVWEHGRWLYCNLMHGHGERSRSQ